MDPLVKIKSIKDQVGFDPATLQTTKAKVVVFTVGSHGPFTFHYAPEEYNPARVEADIQNEVNVLKALGTLATEGK